MELIRCSHEQLADIRFHDGALPHVIGACCYQVTRASADLEQAPEKRGFTYNHAPMLAYWNGFFWYEYLAGPKGEHETPSAVYLCRSADGIHWEAPMEVFGPCEISKEPYRGPGREQITGDRVGLVAHHRMGFFTSSAGRLLVMSFYGICPNAHIAPNNGYGVGRVVREVYPDGTLSDVYFLRYNAAAGYDRDHVDLFAPYEESLDAGFVEACRELLADRVVTQQWWEEEQLDREFFTCTGAKALSYYTLPDGRIMGVFKNSLTSISEDHGKTWSRPEKSPDIITSTGKVWGQRIPDGRYALVYNPSPDGAHRWPLAITVGENGREFTGLAAIVPEIAPCRYEGALKNLGAQYMRGITEANQKPEDDGIWIAYSVNKEDMWIARVPGAVSTRWKGPVCDNMETISDRQLRDTWNLYVPVWGGAGLENGTMGKRLHLWDCDPCNRARAERVFEAAETIEVKAVLEIESVKQDSAAALIQSRDGQNLLAVVFTGDGDVAVRVGGRSVKFGFWQKNCVLELTVRVNCRTCSYEVRLEQNGQTASQRGAVGAAVRCGERVIFATKYSLPFQGLEVNGKDGDIGNLPGADRPVEVNSVFIHRLNVC
ncbi:MAG: hypothetical protein IJ468_13810 [Lachnospiraceae bacterium]|nr:hypothetical protein [Lachnospiraceae bacterium]